MCLNTYSVVNHRVFVQAPYASWFLRQCRCQSSHSIADVHWQFWSNMMPISINMGKLLWRIWYLSQWCLGYFKCGGSFMEISISSILDISGYTIESRFPVKSTDGPCHWLCKRTIYTMLMLTLLYYCFFQHTSLLLLHSYIFLLIIHWQWFNNSSFTICWDWIL